MKPPQHGAGVCPLVNTEIERHQLSSLRPFKGTSCSGTGWNHRMLAQTKKTADVRDRPFNNLLRRLSISDFALLEPHLLPADAPAGELLYNPGGDVDIVHFPFGP